MLPPGVRGHKGATPRVSPSVSRLLTELNDLFLRHPNVQLALSGHNHVRDDITYNTVRFACGGAVAGNWWDEADPGCRDTPASFAIVDLYRDGSADIRLFSYREVGQFEVCRPTDGPDRHTL